MLAIPPVCMGRIIRRTETYVCDTCDAASDTDNLQTVMLKSTADKPGLKYDACPGCIEERVIPALGGRQRGTPIKVRPAAGVSSKQPASGDDNNGVGGAPTTDTDTTPDGGLQAGDGGGNDSSSGSSSSSSGNGGGLDTSNLESPAGGYTQDPGY